MPSASRWRKCPRSPFEGCRHISRSRPPTRFVNRHYRRRRQFFAVAADATVFAAAVDVAVVAVVALFAAVVVAVDVAVDVVYPRAPSCHRRRTTL